MKERSGVSWASLGITSFVCLVMFSLLFAGGPRAVLNNQALKWNVSNPDTFPVRYVIDNGPLGEGLSRDQGAALVRQGFQKWEDVSTSTMRFLDSGFLDMDIGVDNYQSFVFTGQPRPENPVIFGDPGDPDTGIPNEVDFAAGLPLQTTLFEKAIFSQVANGATNPEDSSTDTFTGIALYNPNSSSAQITVRVFDREGMLVGEKSLSLSENERTSQLIEDLIPETADLIGGHIVVESTRPIVGQAFFGNNTLQFLSAIPPIIVE